jgi:hypothetical protein
MTASLNAEGERRNPPPSAGSACGRRLALCALALAALALTGGLVWRLGRPGGTPAGRADAPGLDDSARQRLLRAVVRVAPDSGEPGGAGVLLDREARLVVTLDRVVGDRPGAWVSFPVAAPAEAAGRVAFRASGQGLVLLLLDRVPDAALPLPLGEGPLRTGQVLYSVRAADGSCSRGTIRVVRQPPHFCGVDSPTTPWMVGMEPALPFCDAGTPVVDERGALVAIGASLNTDGGSLTRLIDASAVRQALQDWHGG